MAVHQHHKGWSSIASLSWRAAAQRFSFLIFLILSCGLLVLGRTNPYLVQQARGHIVDGVAPVLSAVSSPLEWVSSFAGRVSSYMALQAENERLRSQLAQMSQWQNAVVALNFENKELRSLLHFKAEPRLAYVSARVIAETGGPFVRSLIATVGSLDGARVGMAAMTGDGLIGRVVETSDHSARILLLTDLNSRIPVIVTGTGDQAIVAGDNSAQLKLLYLPQDTAVETGARVITSGHGGIFPPNLPVGTVVASPKGNLSVAPLASLGSISYITLIDFNLEGGPANAIASRLNESRAFR